MATIITPIPTVDRFAAGVREDELEEARALAWETAQRLNTERDTTRRIVAKLVRLVMQVFDLKSDAILRDADFAVADDIIAAGRR